VVLGQDWSAVLLRQKIDGSFRKGNIGPGARSLWKSSQRPSWFGCKNGKLVKSFVMEKEWLDSPLGVLIPSTIACFFAVLASVPIKMYW
jgi:hypothetical protein